MLTKEQYDEAKCWVRILFTVTELKAMWEVDNRKEDKSDYACWELAYCKNGFLQPTAREAMAIIEEVLFERQVLGITA